MLCDIFHSPSAAAVQSCLSAVGHYRLQARAWLTRRARFTYYCAPTPPPPYLNARVRAPRAFAHSRPPTLVLARACRRGPRTRSIYAAFISRHRFTAAGVPDACRARRRWRSSMTRPLPGWFPKILYYPTFINFRLPSIFCLYSRYKYKKYNNMLPFSTEHLMLKWVLLYLFVVKFNNRYVFNKQKRRASGYHCSVSAIHKMPCW